MTVSVAPVSLLSRGRSLPPAVSLALTLWAGQALAAAPVAKLTVVRAVVAGQSVSAQLLASDADGDTLTLLHNGACTSKRHQDGASRKHAPQRNTRKALFSLVGTGMVRFLQSMPQSRSLGV